MDSLVAAAGRALAAGDPLGALKHVALRSDPDALALRGIAMAQLGDYERARKLLRRAARGFGTHERHSQARCIVAEAEVALAARDLKWDVGAVAKAAKALDTLGDHANAIHGRLVVARRHLLVGDLVAAGRILGTVDASPNGVPAALAARTELTRTELALRHLRAADAARFLERAQDAAAAAAIPSLAAEVGRTRHALSAPSARLIRGGIVRPVRVDEVEALFASGDLVVDACRRVVRGRGRNVSLARRPILFALAGALAEAWPHDVARDRLIEKTFRARHPDDSHRARLRVEMSRLRAALRTVARVDATAGGFVLSPADAAAVALLAPPIDGEAGAIVALLEGGESWSTSALASALGATQRSVQRALRELDGAGAVRAVGRGRSRRWLAPSLSGFATNLLLPGALRSR